MAYRYLIENPKSLHLLRSKLKHIIVDEYQDMSVSQHALLRLVVRGVVGDEDIAPSHSNRVERKKKLPILLDAMDLNGGYKSSEEASYSVPSLFCAGDSSQSIYGWRGAAPVLTVDGFRKDFPQGVVAPLDVCYRLSTDILDAANMLLPPEMSRSHKGNISQKTKSFDVSPAAAAKVASNVSGSSSSHKDQTRGNSLLGNELLLSKGMKKLDSTVLIHGLWDDREEAKYIASTIRRRSKERRKSLLKALRNLDDNLSAAQEKELLDLTDVAVLVRSSKQINMIEEALTKAGIPFTVTEKHDGEDPSAPLAQRKQSGKEEMLPMRPVNIMTMHKAKGEEFDDIYLAGWTEGEFPHPEATSSNRVHEERRLAYVALTRARQRVVITHSFMSRKLHFGRGGTKRFVTSQVAPSRFLYELVPSKKHIDGIANKNEVLDGDNVGTFWDRSAGIKEYVAGTNIPQWFQESFKKPSGYVSRREDVRPHTTLLENTSVTESMRQSKEVATSTSHLQNESSMIDENEASRASAPIIEEEEETEMTDSSADKSVDYSSMTVLQLKDILRSKGLKVSGRKAILIERLESEGSASALLPNSNDDDNSSITVEQLDRILERKGLNGGTRKKVLIERLKSENIRVEKSLLDYLSMTVVQIKKILRSNGLKVSGRKAVLIQRVVSSLSNFRRS
jgi:ATP-dependent exoDNAse (exonuclease V) beta subunit